MDERDWYLSRANFKNQIIVDVGANTGTMTEFFWKASEGTSKVVVVEPVPENLEKIKEKETKLQARFIYYPYAVSDSSGVIQFMTATQKFSWGVNGQVVTSQNSEYPLEQSDVSFECRKLSELVPDATMVKMDIEGHEYVVFPQALKELPGVHTWMVELHRRKEHPLENILGLFADHGFELHGLNQGKIEPTLTWEGIPKSFYKTTSKEERWLKKINIMAQKF